MEDTFRTQNGSIPGPVQSPIHLRRNSQLPQILMITKWTILQSLWQHLAMPNCLQYTPDGMSDFLQLSI